MSSTSLPVGSLRENAARERDAVPGTSLRSEGPTLVSAGDFTPPLPCIASLTERFLFKKRRNPATECAPETDPEPDPETALKRALLLDTDPQARGPNTHRTTASLSPCPSARMEATPSGSQALTSRSSWLITSTCSCAWPTGVSHAQAASDSTRYSARARARHCEEVLATAWPTVPFVAGASQSSWPASPRQAPHRLPHRHRFRRHPRRRAKTRAA